MLVNSLRSGAAWFFLLFCLSTNASAGTAEIVAGELKKMIDSTDILVVFPLSPIEFDNLHIPGSVNIPLENLKAGLPADKERKIAFYCLGRTCTAAPSAAEKAAKAGYRNLFVFRDGLPGWVAAGYPTQTTATLPEADIPTISPAELKTLLAGKEDFVLLDIRSQEKHLRIDDPRSLYLDLNTMKDHWREVPGNKKIVMIDYNGKRTQVAGRYLAGKGIKNVRKVSGGMMQWVKDGYPVRQVN
jgi:rhodanese-related sulfurtransferase